MKLILRALIGLKLTYIKQFSKNQSDYFQKTTIVVLYLCFISHINYAQLDNRKLEQRFAIDSTHQLRFRLTMLGFVKNNEYFGPIADGYTLFGYQLNPRVAYQPAPNVVLELGAFFRNDFGQERIAQIAPTFTVKFRHKNWNYLFGTLEGSVGHRLIEPLYQFERLLQNRLENGLQINHLTERTFFDGWVSYLRNTLPGYTRQEHFWGGFSFETRLAGKLIDTGWSVSVPIQLTVFHAGGQNINSPLPVRTALNAAGSLSLAWQNAGPGFFRSVRLDSYVVGYTENAERSYTGGAFYPNLTVTLKPVTVLASYWHGNDYRAELGGDLYQSYSRRYQSTYQETQRQLLIVRFLKDIPIAEGLSVTIRFEPLYDFHSGHFEHSEGVYINFTH